MKMNGVTGTASPVSKRSISPRPPAVGEEVKKFHDTSHRFPELYTNRSMECQSKTCSGESADHLNTTICAENPSDLAECTGASTNPNPPASLNWAQSLQTLLEDIQGVALFQKFLKHEGHDTRCLKFWFACRGVKKNNPNDREALIKLIKVVFEKKVKRISVISDETKEEIRQKLANSTDVDDTIFDKAQQEVETYMMKTTFPNFLRSDLYIQYFGGLQNKNSPEKEHVVSPESLVPLQTVLEDSELTIASNKYPLTVLPRTKISSVSKFKPEGPAGYLRSPYSNYSNYHTKYGSYLPASAQDSELQSLSSDAQTDDTMSLTDRDSNVDYPLYNRSKQKRSQTTSKHFYNNEMIINKDELRHGGFIPRTERLPEAVVKPNNMKEFHAAVCKKLLKYIEDQKANEKVTEKLKSVEVADSLKSEGMSFPNPIPHHKSNSNQVFQPEVIMPIPLEDNSEEILDQHISRVFENSGQYTPASGCTSPPALRSSSDVLEKSRVSLRVSGCCDSSDPSLAASHKHNQAHQFTVPNSIKYKRDHDTRSIDSAMFDYISDDNLPTSYRNQYSAVGSSEPVDYSRRSKEHSKRYGSKKFSSMTNSSNSCVDSGISLACESVPSYSKVTHWLEAKRMCEQEREQCLWRNSSTSPVLSRSSSSRKTVGHNSCRSGNQDIGYSQWSGPSQFSQDCMAGYPPLDTTSNLLEARRRLEDENKAKLKLKKPNRKSCSINVVETATANTPCNDMTVICYSYGRHSVPYLSRLPEKNITLRHFKSYLSKKGNFRYFFKTASNDFGTGVVFEEVTDDCKILPLWEGKVFCVIETIDDTTVM